MVNEDLIDDFQTNTSHTFDGEKVAEIQGRHGLIPVSEDGARTLIRQLRQIFDFDQNDTKGDQH